jgi:hypothetical protein
MAITRIGNPAIADVRGVNFRNIIINGDMSVSQRSTSASSITSSGYHALDRHRLAISSLGTWTISQSTDVPTGQGFGKSMKFDCTTADASPSASDVMWVQHRIEGQNLQYLKKGTSSAEKTTLSFWVKSNKTGTYIAELEDTDNSRHIAKSYTISSSDTWEKKTITFDGDTTGTLTNDNNTSLELHLYLGAGTNYTSGTLATSWASNTDANRAVGQVNLADSTSNEWYVTGIQLETGSQASDFEFLPRDISLQRCYRYCYKTPTGSLSQNSGEYCNAHHYTATTMLGLCSVNPVEMRVPFTVTFSGSFESYGASAVYSISSLSSGEITSRGFQINGQSSTGRTVGQAVTIRNAGNTTAFILQEAEL